MARPRPTVVPVGKGRWTVNGLQLVDSRGIPILTRARGIQASLGTHAAARFLFARGWSVEAAAFMLSHRRVRK